MVMGKRFDSSIESKWQEEWEKHKVYQFDENDTDKPIYSIDTPPPFTSGKLHMGHVLSYAYFDFPARYKRMQGYNVYFPQGWDCQGFPTEVKVEKKYGSIETKNFIKHCTDWTQDMICKMKKQMKMLGHSPDWRYEYRTMDKNYHRLVQLSLIKMYDKEDLYNDEHPVLWCPNCKSAITKAETEEIERDTQLNYILFTLDDGEEVEIATTRPELLHACVAVMYHPEDERYTKYKDKKITTPLGKKVPMMPDKDVDKEFGTGLVMVCTFGDKQDIVWTYRYKLPVIKAFDESGKVINSNGLYDGFKYKEARRKVLHIIKDKGLFVKGKNLRQIVKVHDRCDTPAEHLLSSQWFIKVLPYKDDILKSAKEINWHPDFGIHHIINWLNTLEWDWVISRQRVWGTPIPLWYCEKCEKWFHPDESELPVDPRVEKRNCPNCGEEAKGETAVCDVWVDSSISPLIISKWQEDDEFFDRIYPCTLRPQGYEIVRTWAFYTLFRCKYFTDKTPFKDIILNGNVLDPKGKKMSKSKGNSIDPIELIGKYSADALRQWAALSGAMAKDKPFSYNDVKYSQSFLNKLWNATRFIESHIKDYEVDDEHENHMRMTDKWIRSRLFTVIAETTEHLENYKYHHALKGIQNFVWHEMCDYYLEYVKHRLYEPENYGEDSRNAVLFTLHTLLDNIAKLLAPFTPHIAEEIYQIFHPEPDRFVVQAQWPQSYGPWFKPKAVQQIDKLNKIIDTIREFRGKEQMKRKVPIKEIVIDDENLILDEIKNEIINTGNVENIVTKKESKELNITINQ